MMPMAQYHVATTNNPRPVSTASAAAKSMPLTPFADLVLTTVWEALTGRIFTTVLALVFSACLFRFGRSAVARRSQRARIISEEEKEATRPVWTWARLPSLPVAR